MTSDNKQRGCVVNISRRKNLIALGLAAILGIFAGESVHADHLLPGTPSIVARISPVRPHSNHEFVFG